MDAEVLYTGGVGEAGWGVEGNVIHLRNSMMEYAASWILETKATLGREGSPMRWDEQKKWL